MKCLKGSSFDVTMLAVGASVTQGHPLCWFMLALGHLEPEPEDFCTSAKMWVKSLIYKKKMSVVLSDTTVLIFVMLIHYVCDK